MRKIGIIGKIGSGKSYISQLLREKGKIVIDLDSVAKSFYNVKNIKAEMKNIFGDDIYFGDKLNNKKLADIIFNDTGKLEQVEKLLKPYILDELHREYYQQQIVNNQDVIFVESATMMKTGLYKDFDEIIYVDAPYFLRQKQVVEKRGISEEDFKNRNDLQMNFCDIRYLLEKENIAYNFVDNNYTDDIIRDIKSYF